MPAATEERHTWTLEPGWILDELEATTLLSLGKVPTLHLGFEAASL